MPKRIGSPPTGPVALQQRRDRRKAQRSAYPATVQIDGRPAPGRDISPKGLSVLMEAPAVGDVVRVTLAAASAKTEAISAPARVVRVEATKAGFVVGLEFIE